MTTRIGIINFSTTHSVKLEVQQRRDDGKYQAAWEKTIAPQQYAEEYIHAKQTFQVIEIEE